MVRNIDIKKRNIGVTFENNLAHINLWAPQANKVRIKIENSALHIDLTPKHFGYWTLQSSLLKPGDHYQFEITTDEGSEYLPDPASVSQPLGVHGLSKALDLAQFSFTDQSWKGVALNEYVIYELHTGTFSSEGTFSGIADKLDHLISLGITAIEIMPVAAFPGERNWGYDGVFPFAVQESYGGARALQQLINLCHQKGLAVILDVVYNHLGPEGNYFKTFGEYFTDKYKTPWGEAINFDDAYADGVRNFYIENLIMWFRDFHIDALRLDAVHAIKDFSAKHILAEMKAHVDLLNQHTNKQHYLIVECDLNDPKYIAPLHQGGYGMDAQWMDEFHHTLRVAAGQERNGYYADFNGVAHLAKSYQDAYVYDGIYSEERKKTFGAPAASHPGQQFVVFSQNHDQVGNRMLGERSGQLYSFEMQKLLAGAVLVSPFVPLLFMGEEWGETNPFLYFVSHSDPELIAAVRKGRASEFKAFHHDAEAPDPQDETTFLNSKLQWQLLESDKHQQLFVFYKTLISLRKTVPALGNLNREKLKVEAFAEKNLLILHRWDLNDSVKCFLNFSEEIQAITFTDSQDWHPLIDSASTQFGGSKKSSFAHSNNQILNIEPQSIVIFKRTNE